MVESAENPKAIENHQNQPSKSSIIAAAVEALIMASLSVLLAWLEDSAGRFLGEAVDEQCRMWSWKQKWQANDSNEKPRLFFDFEQQKNCVNPEKKDCFLHFRSWEFRIFDPKPRLWVFLRPVGQSQSVLGIAFIPQSRAKSCFDRKCIPYKWWIFVAELDCWIARGNN